MSGRLNVLLQRILSGDEGTLGQFVVDGERACYAIELPWRENRPDISCIPAGVYWVEYLERSASGRYRDVYHLTDVPGRSGILIHAGNWAGDATKGYRTHSYGCILPGARAGRLGGQRAVLASAGGLSALHEVIGRRPFNLVVQEVRDA